MERFNISVKHNKEVLKFEVADYLYHTDDHCKFEVYKDGQFAASFEPDRHRHLYVCKNSGIIKEEVLHLLADKLEELQPILTIDLPGRY